jgi:DNA mismatch repair protein MutS
MTKTIVKRGVTELVTPGVSMNDEGYSLKQITFSFGLFFQIKILVFLSLDVSTGEFLNGTRECRVHR